MKSENKMVESLNKPVSAGKSSDEWNKHLEYREKLWGLAGSRCSPIEAMTI